MATEAKKAYFIRVPENMYEVIKAKSESEQRSINGMANVLMGYALNHYPEGVGTPIQIHPPVQKPEVPKPEKNKSSATHDVSDLISAPSESAVVPTLEQECCLNENAPCKHWVWDTATGDGYINTLSGRSLEVE